MNEPQHEYQMPKPNIKGWMFKKELEWLYDRAKEMGTILEVGSWKGRSVHALLLGCQGPVFAIDHFKGNPSELKGKHQEATYNDISQTFFENVGHFSNLAMLKMNSQQAVQLFADKSIDMIFIDGEHTYEAVKQDLALWIPKCKKLLCGHDFNMVGVKQALSDYDLKIENPVLSIWTMELP